MQNLPEIKINYQILAELKAYNSSDGNPLLLRLIELFKEETPITFEEIKKSISIADYNQVAKYFHKLKGVASNLGLEGLASFYLSLEEEAKNSSKDLIIDFDYLREIYFIYMTEFEKIIKE
jgi:HPt (histidine-containing phosphotransfer) domain-containing protein